MSQSVVDWAVSQVVGFPEPKFVLITLAMEAKADGRGNVMLSDLARWTELEEAKLPPILHTLENFGLAYTNVGNDGVVRFRLAIDKPGARLR